MVKKKKQIFVVLILTILVLTIFIPVLENFNLNSDLGNKDIDDNAITPKASINLDGVEDIKIINIKRIMTLRGTGLLVINDTIIIENQNSNPISSVLLGIPSNTSDDLIYLKAVNNEDSILDAQLTDFIMEDSFQIIQIDLLNSLQSQENITITILQSYKDLIMYEYVGGSDQKLSFSGYVFPLFPYEIQNEIITEVIPLQYSGYSGIIDSDWGEEKTGNIIEFKTSQDSIEPFLANVGDNKTISISVKYSVNGGASSTTKTEMSKIERTIKISPWGIITVSENYYLTNLGPVALNQFKIGFPKVAINERVFDFFGDLSFSNLAADPEISSIKTGVISLGQSRGVIEPNSTYEFSLEYQVSLYTYLTKNIIQQTIRMNLCTSYFLFLEKNVQTKIIIEGCFSIDGSTIPPDEISASTGYTTLTYDDNYLSPSHFEDQIITLTYTVDSFGLMFWPTFYMIVIAVLCVLYVYFVYRRKRKGITSELEEKEIPVNEIREFCSLYSEKTALILEIRKAESDLKSKKIPKKKYRMLVKKNENKIDAIEEELKPFKDTLMQTNETFEGLVKRLEVLETERQTVIDGLNLLDLRYRKGKLPSRTAYMSLKDDFQKRMRKIDRSIDKTIQQLRGYLI
ncbi:MAG: hypothetical protein EU541_07440 [Promethearchaeota archaeon]|nr:MAG: hypothetical protein EU541_07440 [Candidatus Lokiarchaeota archaeon]